MIPQIVILSGPIGSGKTTLAAQLCERYGLFHFKSSDYLIELAKNKEIPAERRALQTFGDALDRKTNGEWIVAGLRKKLQEASTPPRIVIDAVRIQKQIDAVRNAFGLSVAHVHLTAPDAELEKRYLERQASKIREFKSYKPVRANPTERKVPQLAREADVVIDTKRNRVDDVVVRVASHLGLYGRDYLRLMSQEITWDDVASRAGLDAKKLKEAEKTSTTNRDRRVAEFDWVLLRKSATLNAPTDVALSFADYISATNEDARRFEQLSTETIRFIEEIERVAAAPVSLISTRFHNRSIIDRRAW